MENKIGVLLPQSSAHPQIGKSFINGLRIGLGNLSYKLFLESTGLGEDPKQIINSIQKLHIQEDVALTTGLFGHYGFKEIAEFVSKNDEILLASNFGTSFSIKAPDGVFQNTLGLQDSLIKLAQYFSKKNVKNLATSSCYYESGYGFIKGLEIGIKNQEITKFAGHYITPHSPRKNESEIMEFIIKESNPEVIVAFHNGIFAEEHFEFLQKNNLQNSYPIYALPFSSEDKLIEKYPEIGKKIKSISSWYKELDSESNKKFTATYQQTYNKLANFFALLGYENGLVIKDALTQKNKPLKQSIEEINIDGPRGKINFNNAFHKTDFPHYIWTQEVSKESEVIRKPIEELPKNNLNYLANLPEEETTSQGWFNAYLHH
ncbi:ABC transporter substrate-binding protein [Polaribacter batillariae]|uniref:ABC transporter substrate-binding protein n=1 Tax=Polaribacter batillariae TaxID=2808900 RepID=A0ABX7SR76_9FLAO|nr:ABC transporter substrate-binding protein [Polaribacter batillariae]QTD36641.1 ABC transporter substrate-binding protein [Polaribacter batillariae]